MKICVLLAIAGFAAGATAQVTPNNGDIIFTSQQANAIKLISGTTPGGATTLYASSNPITQYTGISLAPDGNYYVGDGRVSGLNPNDAGITRVNNIFSGSASVTPITVGNPLQNPVNLAWSNDANRFVVVNNPAGPQFPQVFDGIFGVTTGGAINTYFSENTSTPRPNYNGGFGIIQDPRPGSRDFLITAVNGGVDTDTSPSNPFPFDAQASTVWRLAYNVGTNSYNLGTSPLVDFSPSVTGFTGFYNTRGIAAVPGTNSFFTTDLVAGVINKVTLDALGNFQSVQTILTGLNQPESIIYNPFTNQLVFDERGNLTASQISTVNLDGTGRVVLYAGEHARGFAIVPSPASAALLGLGGLLAARRRRA
jgi:hypothetical protein